MKTQFKFLVFAATFFAGTMAAAGFQSNSAEEVPGDNFSLEGALELFKKSTSPQEFEQLLNSPDSKVNNLDLNGDGEIDYIRVVDKTEGNIHAFILSAVVSSNESQDVAVIELEKRADGTAVLQIVGDADVYGIETIIEPTDEVRVNAGASTRRTIVNVWAWPSVQYVYGPYYNVWVSPWRWSYYPGWYRPWRPYAWTVYDPYWAPYRPYYSVCYRHRVVYAPVIYRPYRATSIIVHNRHYTQIDNFRTTSHGYRYDRNSDHGRNNRYDNDRRSGNDYTSRNNRSNDSFHSNGRSVDRSNDRSTNRSRTFDSGNRSNGNNGFSNDANRTRSNGVRRSLENNDNRSNGVRRSFENNSTPRSNDRSTSFHRSSPDNSSNQRPMRQFSAPAHREQSAPQQFHRSEAPGHSGGNSGIRSMPQQHQRSSAPAHFGGGGGGGRTRGHH